MWVQLQARVMRHPAGRAASHFARGKVNNASPEITNVRYARREVKFVVVLQNES